METEKIRDLMEAYYSIYESKEEPEMKEGEEEDKEEHKGKKKGKKEKEEKDEDLEETASDPSSQLRKMRNKNFPQQKPKPLEEDADLFDYLLEYLVAEGYADTNKAALAIMANMSEDWRNEIVEQSSARSREFEKRLPAERGSRGREFEHGSTRSAGTPSGNLADKSPRDPKTGKLMY